MSFRVPAFAARHRHALVKAAIPVAKLIYDHRHSLDRPLRDVHGHTVLPALPHLRLRPLQGETTEQLDKRRADFMQGLLSVWLVMLGSISYESKAVLARAHATAPDPFMSLRELAELAELVDPKYSTTRKLTQADGTSIEVAYRDPGDRVERITRFMRAVGMISETKQHREEKADGRHRATGNGIRRVVFKVACFVFGGRFAQIARDVHGAAMKKKEQRRLAQAEADDQFRAALGSYGNRQGLDELTIGEPDTSPPAARAPGQPDPVLLDLVHDEHPDWDYPRLAAEARRLEAIGIEVRGPPDDTS